MRISDWSSDVCSSDLIPTYLRVREVHKRAIEFIMDLDVHKLELERQRLKELIDENARNWQSVVDEMTRQARREGGALAGLPTRPTTHADPLERGSLPILEIGRE